MRDPYEVLGVKRDASDAEIKKAYRRLAKNLHPDVRPDDAKLAERFKEVSAAYKLLSDKETRRRYDAGEIGPDGQERPHFRYEYAGGSGGPGASGGFGGFDPRDAGFGARGFSFNLGGGGGADDLFSELFGSGRRRPSGPVRGADVRYALTIDFLDAVRGATKRIALSAGKTLKVDVPAGIADGQQIRLRGQGEPGPNGGPAGDALIEIAVSPHPSFRREGDDIHLELPVSLPEAVLGAKVEVPTIDGPVSVTVPKNASSGRTLRLKGRGVKRRGGDRGDQLVKLRIALPEKPDAELETLIRDWAESHDYDPRGRG